MFYGYYYSLPTQATKADTWAYFVESKTETNILLSNPNFFIADLFTNYYEKTGNLFSCTNSFWNDLKATSFIKLLAVLNIFSNKNYFINVLFFNFFFLLGSVAFYRLFKENFSISKWLLIVFVFFTPSFLFWCSGIHKDGVIFSATAISIFIFHKALKDKFSAIRLFILIICFALIFLLRNYYLLAILPALLTWYFVIKFKQQPKRYFVIAFLSCLLFLFFANSFPLTEGISKSIVEKHDEFLKLEGNTKFQTPKLENNTSSFVSYLPFAIQSILFRPFLNNTKSFPEFLATLENYLFNLFILLAFFVAIRKRKEVLNSPILLACFTSSFLLLLFIGYTVCFDAAIIRYRSVSFPLLIVPSLILFFGKNKEV